MNTIKKLPKHTPPLGVMLEALGRPHPIELARALGAGERTVRRWIADDDAPRAVLLALFWITHWGAQWLDADNHNRLLLHMRASEHATKEADALRRDLARLAAQLQAQQHAESAHDGPAPHAVGQRIHLAPPKPPRTLYVVR